MTWYDDLSPWTEIYTSEKSLVAVGWLEKGHPYPRGDVAREVLDRLVAFLVKPWQPFVTFGYHDCALCKSSRAPYILTYGSTTITMGASNVFIPGEGYVYIAPSLIVHYITEHGYTPPKEFCDALLRCPPMHSQEYIQAILGNGGTHLVAP